MKQLNSTRYQKGVTLLLVLMLLGISVSASVYFHQRVVSTARISGATRDNSASLMMAEGAMEKLRGGFINTLDSLPNADSEPACGVSGNSYDNCEAYFAIWSMDKPTVLESIFSNAGLNYIFYVGATGITQTKPSILQSIANGSAAASDAAYCTVGSRVIGSNTCKLKIDDMFGVNHNPKLYTTNSNGLLVDSSTTSWNLELARTANNDTVAAAWLEFTQNADDAGAVDIWAQATARVGAANSFVQRYVGTFYAVTSLGGLSALIEASNIDRRIRP